MARSILALTLLCFLTQHGFATAQTLPTKARVVWVREPRVYLASADSLKLLPGTRLMFMYRGKKLAEGKVTAVFDTELIAAELTSGSLKGAKKLERLTVGADRSVLRAKSLLRVGYPTPGRSNLLLACRSVALSQSGGTVYRTEPIAERSSRLVRDMDVAAQGPWPDTLLVRLFDEAADEEIALERGELDVAVFWPGEASPHIREFARWQGNPLGMRGWIGAAATGRAAWGEPVALGEPELRLIASLNQEIFRGDLGPCSVTYPRADGADSSGGSSVPGATRFEVDSSFPGRQVLEQFLNRGGRPVQTADAPRPVRIFYQEFPRRDLSDSLTMKCLFTVGCPVITAPELRPYIEMLGADALVNLFYCEPAKRKP